MKLTEAKLKKMIREQLEEAYDNDRYSKIKPWSPEAAGLVYYDRSDSTPPIPPGYVRTAAVLDGTRQPNPARLKRYQKNHVLIYLKQPGFKAVEDVPISDPRGAEEHQRQMDQVERTYQDAMDRLGPDEPNKDEDWNAWYTWSSQKLQSRERYNDSMGKLRSASTVRLPHEYGEGEQTFVEHEIQLDGKFIEPADDGRYIDVANFILKKKKITDQYGNLLDFNGRVIAGKKLQKRFSGASDMPWAEYLATLNEVSTEETRKK